MLTAEEAGGQFGVNQGDKVLAYGTSRFFQSYLHLYLARTLLSRGGFRLNVGLSPGFEYSDHVLPISSETVHFENDWPVTGQYDLYEVMYHRMIAFGLIAKADVAYDFGNKYVAAGYERAHYFKENQINNFFVRLGVKFN